jgi:protein tyrosine/serine phosphatase
VSATARSIRIAGIGAALLLALLDPRAIQADPAVKPPAASLLDGTRVSERIFGLPGLSNVGRVAPGVYRGAQPKPDGYATLKAMGIRTIINLRLLHSEREAVTAAGMRSIEIPMNTFKDVNLEKVKRVIGFIRDPANQPVFVHCAHGQDRTGIVVAAYRMEADGWSREDAIAEMQAFGFNDIWHELMEFVRKYQATASRRP